jgi:hypothetical protein
MAPMIRSLTTLAIAEAITMIMIATIAFGSQATIAFSIVEIGFAPNTPNAICSVISKIV